MLLIITNQNDLASDYLILRLKERNIAFKRFNTEEYPDSVHIDIKFEDNFYSYTIHFEDGFIITPENLSAVYFRQPLVPKLNDVLDPVAKSFAEDEFLETLRSLWRIIPENIWLNHPRRLWVASNKVEQLIAASNIGFSIPKTLITYSKNSLSSFVYKANVDLVAKAVRHGFVRDRGKVLLAGTQRLPKDYISKFDSYMHVPMTYQEEIKKDFDVRVVVIGDDVFATKIYSNSNVIDWRVADIENKNIIHEMFKLPDEIKHQCISIVKSFDLRYSSIDMIRDINGTYYFLELNPNGQWAWIEQLTEYKIRDSIIDEVIKDNNI